MGNETSSDASDKDGGMSGMNLGLQNLNLGDQPRSRPLDLPGNLFGKDDEGTRKEGERAEQLESSLNTSRDGQRGHQGEREKADEWDGGHGGGVGRHISFENSASKKFAKEEDAKGGWPANNFAEKKKRVEPSELQLKLLEDLKQENKRLLQLKDHYRLRMASASPAHFHSIKLQRKVSMPRFEATEDGILVDSQIDKTLPVVLEDFKLNSKQKNSSGVVGMLTIRNCASSVETGATVSCIRTLGEVKRFIIEDCQHYLIVIDGVTDACTISNSSNLTVVIGGNLPSIVLTKCKNISFVSAVRNYGENGRKYELCMSACSGIVTQLLTDSIISEKGLSHEDLKTGITIMRYRDDARTVHLPDTVEATVKSNSLKCVLRAMAKINDESIPWVADSIVEFANVYRGHKLSEAEVGMPDREEAQVSEVTEEAFRMFDTDGSGCISRDEFEQAMMALGFRPSEALWLEADADGSGEIDVDEFAEVIRKNRIDLTAELEMLTPEERDRLKEAKGAKFRKYKLMPRAKVGNG